MLNKVNPNQAVMAGFVLIILIEFLLNVLINDSRGGKTLSVEAWDTSIFAEKTVVTLAPLNALFGLRSEAEIEQEKRAAEKAKAEQAQADKDQKPQDEVLVIGKDNVRLFGISLSQDEQVAIISVKNAGKEDKLHNVKQGESLVLHDGKSRLIVEKVLTDAIQVSVINNKEEKSSFNLVIFNYGI